METQMIAPVPMNLSRNQGAPAIPGVSTGVSVPLPKPHPTSAELEQMVADAENQRMATLRRAAASSANSSSFAIYKDAMTGQYITRITNKSDGRVTYIPEPDILSWLNQGSGNSDPLMELNI